jgi:Flp pilus assembly protein TadG
MSGASMLEFALVSPLALVLVLAIIQIGMVYIAKLTVNQAAFMAARAGAVNNADENKMKDAFMRGLIPLYQNATNADDNLRLTGALAAAQLDRVLYVHVLRRNPSDAAFRDFGIYDASVRRTKIPNDNLQFRDRTIGTNSQQNIQDANLLKIAVTYGYELKVPLMAALVRRTMCGIGDSNVNAFGAGSNLFNAADPGDCQYYLAGRIPIRSYATVRMQSPAYQ